MSDDTPLREGLRQQSTKHPQDRQLEPTSEKAKDAAEAADTKSDAIEAEDPRPQSVPFIQLFR